MKSINPYTLELIREYEEDSAEEVKHKIEKAEGAFNKYRQTSFAQREAMMNALADDLQNNSRSYAETLTLEMGKPIKEAVSEVEKCAWVCRYYADNAVEFLKGRSVETDASKSYVSYEPLGVILAVMPWNFPFWQVFRFAAPTLMAGNTALLKHASNVQGCAGLIQEIINKAGFDEGIFQNLRISSDKVEDVLRHPSVKAASVTGSEEAGAAVAGICGTEIKPCVLELGGSNAFIVLQDADIHKAAGLAIKARMINNAQSCIAAKRFIIVHSQVEKFTEVLVEKLRGLKQGDPMRDDVQIGPLARVDLAEKLEQQVEESITKGAELIYGGKRTNAEYQPAVLTGVSPGMPAYEEELFGPVFSIISVDTEDEAIEVANDSRFGLGATIVSRDVKRAEELGKRMGDGAVFINELVKSDPRLPFGGTRKSGFGRELGQEGILEFVNIKTVFINNEIKL